MMNIPEAIVYKRREVRRDYAGAEFLDRVVVNHESVMFSRGQIYPESFAPAPSHRAHWLRPSRFTLFLIRNYLVRRHRNQVSSGLWVIDDMSPNNYYHWLIDCLARVLLAETLAPDANVLLLPRYYQRSAFVEYTLRAFPQIGIRWIEAEESVLVGRLAWIPRTPAYYATDHPTFDRELVSEVAHRVAEMSGAGHTTGRRLYFTRADAPRRRVANEAEVTRTLREHDVETIRIDPDKPWEQIQAAREADLIVGVHGAALSNLIFLPPHGRVIELRYDRSKYSGPFYDVFTHLAEALGIEHMVQPCELAVPGHGLTASDGDLVVDTALLRKALH